MPAFGSLDNCFFLVSDWGYRHQQCVVLFFTLTIAYSMRSCMGVALVAMTDVTESNEINLSNIRNGMNTTNSDYEENILHNLLLVPPVSLVYFQRFLLE